MTSTNAESRNNLIFLKIKKTNTRLEWGKRENDKIPTKKPSFRRPNRQIPMANPIQTDLHEIIKIHKKSGQKGPQNQKHKDLEQFKNGS